MKLAMTLVRSSERGRWLTRLSTALLLVFLAASLGCAEPKVDPFRTGLVYPLDARRIGFVKVWRQELRVPQRSRLTQAQVLGDLLVTVEEPGNVIAAMDVGTGKVLWTRQVGKPGAEVFRPHRVNDRLLLNTETTLVILDAKTGRPLQSNTLTAVVTTPMAVFGDRVVCAGADGYVFAQDIATGREIWAYRVGAAIDLPPVVWDDNALITDIRGVYHLLSMRDGTPQWAGRTFARSSAAPIMSAWGPFIASQDTVLYALDLASGQDRWQFHAATPLTQDPVLLGGRLYQPLGRRGLVALDPQSGQVLWRHKEPAAPMALSGDLLAMYTRPRLRLALAETGEAVAETLVADLQTVLGLPDGSLILVAPDGQIERLDPI